MWSDAGVWEPSFMVPVKYKRKTDRNQKHMFCAVLIEELWWGCASEMKILILQAVEKTGGKEGNPRDASGRANRGAGVTGH